MSLRGRGRGGVTHAKQCHHLAISSTEVVFCTFLGVTQAAVGKKSGSDWINKMGVSGLSGGEKIPLGVVLIGFQQGTVIRWVTAVLQLSLKHTPSPLTGRSRFIASGHRLGRRVRRDMGQKG